MNKGNTERKNILSLRLKLLSVRFKIRFAGQRQHLVGDRVHQREGLPHADKETLGLASIQRIAHYPGVHTIRAGGMHPQLVEYARLRIEVDPRLSPPASPPHGR